MYKNWFYHHFIILFFFDEVYHFSDWCIHSQNRIFTSNKSWYRKTFSEDNYNATRDSKNPLTLNKLLMKFLQTENFSLYSNSFCKSILSCRTLKTFAVAWYRGSQSSMSFSFGFENFTNEFFSVRCKRSHGPAWLW